MRRHDLSKTPSFEIARQQATREVLSEAALFEILVAKRVESMLEFMEDNFCFLLSEHGAELPLSSMLEMRRIAQLQEIMGILFDLLGEHVIGKNNKKE